MGVIMINTKMTYAYPLDGSKRTSSTAEGSASVLAEGKDMKCPCKTMNCR